jgi:hypothetical protein
MKRRTFLQSSAAGIGGLATSLGLERPGATLAADQTVRSTGEGAGQIGRPVRVVSIGFAPDRSLEEIAAMVEA